MDPKTRAEILRRMADMKGAGVAAPTPVDVEDPRLRVLGSLLALGRELSDKIGPLTLEQLALATSFQGDAPRDLLRIEDMNNNVSAVLLAPEVLIGLFVPLAHSEACAKAFRWLWESEVEVFVSQGFFDGLASVLSRLMSLGLIRPGIAQGILGQIEALDLRVLAMTSLEQQLTLLWRSRLSDTNSHHPIYFALAESHKLPYLTAETHLASVTGPSIPALAFVFV